MTTRKYAPGDIIGYTRRGKAIRLIAGGSVDELPTPQPVPQAPQPVYQPQTIPAGEQYFTAEQVERFRQQERDKLYAELSKRDELLNQLKGEVQTFSQEREAFQAAEQARQEAEAAAARKAQEDELSARQLFEQQRTEWEQRFTALEQERAAERAALEKEKEFAALQAYVQRRVREESEAQTIAPELIDLVTGNSSEEVEASIARLKEKTGAIVASMQAAAAQVAPPVPPRGVSPSGYAPTGPMDMHSENRVVTPEEIRQMSMAEYAKFRQQVGIAGQANNGQGLFG